MAAPAPLAVIAIGAGVALVWSAVTGDNPLTELRNALSRGRLDGSTTRRPIEVSPTDAQPADRVPAGVLDIGTPVSYQPGGAPTGPVTVERVRIGQGGHKLSPAAATAFRQAEQNYGRTIPITDSSRDYATQAANYARNPSRFGPPDGNAHVEGRAIDVNLPALGLNPQGEPGDWMRDAGYRRLVEALTAAGWCNYQIRAGTARGRTREPWHFAYGRCN